MSYYPPPGGYPGYPPQGGYPPPAYGHQPSYPPPGYPPQGYPPPGYPPSGYPPSGYPPSGYPPSGYPSHGAPPGYPSHGYPPSGHQPAYGHSPSPYGHGSHSGHHSAPPHVPAPQPPPHQPVQTLVNLLGSQYVLPYETTLVMREIMNWSRDDMDITDVAGTLHFRLRAKIVSMHRKRAVYNNQGNAVCCTMQRVFALRNITYICPGADPSEATRVAEVRKVVFSFTPHAEVFFRGNKSSSPDLLIKGTFRERAFQISNAGGRVLAEVSRDMYSAAARQLGKDTYYVRIFPGVDSALIVVLVTIIEEVFVEANQNEGTGWIN